LFPFPIAIHSKFDDFKMMRTLTTRKYPTLLWTVISGATLLVLIAFLPNFNGRRPQRFTRQGPHQSLPSSIPISSHRELFINTPGSGALKCNGLENLCDQTVNDIMYATVHNANVALESGYFIIPNHVENLQKALRSGYRGINMDIGKCKGQLVLFHFTCLLSFSSLESVLNAVVDFLNENPNEILIFPTELSNEVTPQELDQVFSSVPAWKAQLYDYPGAGNPWPTLRQLIQANTRILFFPYNGQSCQKPNCPIGFNPWFDYAVETQYSFLSFINLLKTESSCQITRGLSGTKDFFGVNTFVTPPRKLEAFKVNNKKFLTDHIETCSELNGGIDVNLVLVNNWKIGDTVQVVQEFNAKLI
jgi:hypothetical protein